MDRKIFIEEDITHFGKNELPKYSDYKLIKLEQFQDTRNTMKWLIVLEYDENRDQMLEDLIKAVNSLEMTFEKTFNNVAGSLFDAFHKVKKLKDKKDKQTESDEEFKQKAKNSWLGQGNSGYKCIGD